MMTFTVTLSPKIYGAAVWVESRTKGAPHSGCDVCEVTRCDCKVIDPKLCAADKANPHPIVECVQFHCRALPYPWPHSSHYWERPACICDTPEAQDARALFQRVEDDLAANKQKLELGDLGLLG